MIATFLISPHPNVCAIATITEALVKKAIQAAESRVNQSPNSKLKKNTLTNFRL